MRLVLARRTYEQPAGCGPRPEFFIGEGTIRRPRECDRLPPLAELPRGGVGAPSYPPSSAPWSLGFRCPLSDAAAVSNAEFNVVGAPVKNTRSPPPAPTAAVLASCSSVVPNIAGLPSRVASAELASSRLRSESGIKASGGVAFTPRNCGPDRAGAGTGASWYAAVGRLAGAGAARGNGTSTAPLPDLEAEATAAECTSFCCVLRGVLGAPAAVAARTWWSCGTQTSCIVSSGIPFCAQGRADYTGAGAGLNEWGEGSQVRTAGSNRRCLLVTVLSTDGSTPCSTMV